MKLLLAVAVSLCSLTALAGGKHHFYGTGTSTYPDGSTQQYLISLVKFKKDGNWVLNYDVQYTDESYSSKLVFVRENSKSDFFSIMTDNDGGMRLAGHGYCWGDTCHVDHDALGFSIEETMYMDRRAATLQHLGSWKDADGNVKEIWQDKMHKLH